MYPGNSHRNIPYSSFSGCSTVPRSVHAGEFSIQQYGSPTAHAETAAQSPPITQTPSVRCDPRPVFQLAPSMRRSHKRIIRSIEKPPFVPDGGFLHSMDSHVVHEIPRPILNGHCPHPGCGIRVSGKERRAHERAHRMWICGHCGLSVTTPDGMRTHLFSKYDTPQGESYIRMCSQTRRKVGQGKWANEIWAVLSGGGAVMF